MTEIRTERLLLRRWRDEDREPNSSMNADPEVMAHFPSPLTRQQSDSAIVGLERHHDEHGYGLWVLDIDGRFGGFAGLQWTDALGGQDLEVGWRLCRWAWGHGYATEAGRAALALGLEREAEIISVTATTNERSWKVMERLGLHRSGTFEHPRIAEGSPLRTHYVYRS